MRNMEKTAIPRMLVFASFALAILASLGNAALPGNAPSSLFPHYLLALDFQYASLALLIPFAIVAIAYMASYAFNVPHIRAILQDEALQIIATGAVALTLAGTQLVVDEYTVAVLNGANATGNNITSTMDAASSVLTFLETKTIEVQDNLATVSIALGKEASKSVFCNFMGVGFTIGNCGPFNAYRGSLTAAMFTTSTALADTYAQEYLLSLARNYAFSILIPLGLFLRCFKVSRAAGGSLIAIGFGFYTVFPAVILATDNLLQDSSVALPSALPLVGTCDPMETNAAAARGDFIDYGTSLVAYDQAESIEYFVLVRVLFMSILNLIITLSFIRAFAHMIGSDIDVSSLARIS